MPIHSGQNLMYCTCDHEGCTNKSPETYGYNNKDHRRRTEDLALITGWSISPDRSFCPEHIADLEKTNQTENS